MDKIEHESRCDLFPNCLFKGKEGSQLTRVVSVLGKVLGPNEPPLILC